MDILKSNCTNHYFFNINWFYDEINAKEMTMDRTSSVPKSVLRL